MDFEPSPNEGVPAERAAAAGSGMETSTAEPPAHGSVFAVPRTPFAPPAPVEDGAPTAPVCAPLFVDPWADGGAGDPMLGGEDVLRAPRAPSPAPMDALPSAKALTPPARAPMALTPPVPPTAPMDAAPTAAAAPMALTPAVPPTAPMDAAPTATAAPMALTPAVPPSIAPMDAAPTAAAAPMALTPPAAPMALTPPAPRAASDAAAPLVVVAATAPAATKGKRVKRQTIGPGGPPADAAAPSAPTPPPPAAAAPPPVAPPAPLAAPTAEAAPAPAAPPPPAAAAPPARPPLPPGARVNAKGETIVRLRRPPPPPPPPPLPPLPPKRSVRKPQHLRTPVEKTPVKKFMPKDALKALLELPNYKALFDGRAFDPKSKTDAELVLAEYRRTQPSRQRGKGQEPILLNDEYWKLSLQQSEPYFQLKLERSKTAAPKGWDDETRPAAPMPRAAPTTVAQFTATLYEILGEDKSEVHCHWSDDGERVVFLDSDAFARSVCPRYFRHSKWTSFVRMLNIYEFRKVSTSPRNARSTRHEFAHEFFTRDRKDLLNRVQRKRRASPRVEDSPDSDVGQPAP